MSNYSYLGVTKMGQKKDEEKTGLKEMKEFIVKDFH